jgi:hypothetical protein
MKTINRATDTPTSILSFHSALVLARVVWILLSSSSSARPENIVTYSTQKKSVYFPTVRCFQIRILFRIRIGFGLEPDFIRSVDTDSISQNSSQKRTKIQKIYVSKSWMFSSGA